MVRRTSPPSILVTNDDGIHSPALAVLAEALAPLGKVTAAAPLREMSASSRSISLFRPVRYETIAPRRYGIDGTPVDAVIVAINHLLEETPSLVVSGINMGANLGLNVFYSGTVGAALEGTMHGIASFAISIGSKRETPLGPTAAFAAELAKWILEHGLPPGMSLNVNVPAEWKQGVRLTKLAHREARRLKLEPENPGVPNSFAIREEIDSAQLAADSDYRAVREGYISITPLAMECEGFASLTWLENWVRDGRMSQTRTYQ
jgi:5'-nucleotidase